MASIYDVVCLNCGEVYMWCKYDPPIEKCGFCGKRLSRRGKWNENAEVFGVWSTNDDVEKVAEAARIWFFEDRPRGYRFRLPNGVLCTIKMGAYPEFWFHFKVRGERISFLTSDAPRLADAVELLKSAGKVPIGCARVIAYKGRSYWSGDPIALTIVKAIEENEKSEVLAAINA